WPKHSPGLFSRWGRASYAAPPCTCTPPGQPPRLISRTWAHRSGTWYSWKTPKHEVDGLDRHTAGPPRWCARRSWAGPGGPESPTASGHLAGGHLPLTHTAARVLAGTSRPQRG